MTEQTVTTGQVPLEGQVPPVVVKPPEPSAEEQKLTELIQKQVAEAVGKATDLAKRELQSVKDKATAEVKQAQRRAQLAENTMTATRTHLQTVDPDVAKEMELAQLRAEREGRTTLEQEDTQTRQEEAQAKALQDSLLANLEALGIDSKDKRIDWAEDSPNYIQGRGRFDASVAKIVKEEKQTMQSGLEQRLKDLEAKVGRVAAEENIEANSVSTAASSGPAAGSDAEFIKKFGNYELPDTKENRARYQKIIS